MDDKSLDILNQEKFKLQENRQAFINRKFTFVIALFSLGNIQFKDYGSLIELLYFVPLIALCFDAYILVEDFRIKRIGEFIKTQDTKLNEWEKWVKKHKNSKAVFVAPSVTFISYLASLFILTINKIPKSHLIIWSIIVLLILLYFIIDASNTRQKFKNQK